MPVRHLVLWIFAVGLAETASAVSAQDFPVRPIRMVLSEAGGNADTNARIVAQGISGVLGQPVVIDNRPYGIIPFEIVHKAPSNGYTLLVTNNGFWLGSLLRKTPYDPVRDYLPITVISFSPSIFVVHPSVPANSVKELIALAKAKPGELNYATLGTGSSSHLAGELFKAMAGVDLVNIPYKGAGLAITDLIAGRLQLMIPPATATLPHVKSGKLRALAVTSAQPSALAPGLPTVTASGLPGFETVSRTGIFAPAKTPASIIDRLNQEIVRFLRTPAAKEKFLSVGLETVGNSPREFAAIMDEEMARIGKVIKDAGIKTE